MSWLDGIGNMVDSFLHPEKGYEKGQNQLDQYYNQGQSYLQPYSQFGQDAHTSLSTAMKRLLDPASLQADWTNGYAESPSAKNAEAMAQEHGLNAASGMGLLGSNTALNAIQNGTTQIGLNDRQNYLDNLMQKYLAGTQIGTNIFNTGAGAAGTMGNNAMTMGGNSAQMAYGGQNAPGTLFGQLLGTGIGAATGGIGKGAGGAGGAGASGGLKDWFLGG